MLETDIYNLRKRISDRNEELQTLLSQKEKEAEALRSLLVQGQSLWIDINSMGETIDDFLSNSGEFIEDGQKDPKLVMGIFES
jgi:hypothetical protein